MTLVNSAVGQARLSQLDVILAGDDVKNKKPDPEIYNTAKGLIGMDATRCIVVEDSIVGLKAAKAAGMRCVITYTSSTEKEDFRSYGADDVLASLAGVTLENIKSYFATPAGAPAAAPVAAVAAAPVKEEVELPGWNLSWMIKK